MKENSNIRAIIEKWKTLPTKAEKDKYFQEVEQQIKNKTPEEFRESLLEVKEAVKQLHVDVFKEASPYYQESILVTPKSQTDYELLKAILKKMNIPFKKVG